MDARRVSGVIADIYAIVCDIMSVDLLPERRGNRHPPFEPGNQMHTSHGARVAEWRLSAEVEGIADAIRPLIADFEPGDEILLRLLATTLARIERASRWVAEQDEIIDKRGRPVDVLKSLAAWESAAAKYLAQLGLSPDSRRRSRSGAGADALAAYLASRQDS
jgi:hypothetical protein